MHYLAKLYLENRSFCKLAFSLALWPCQHFLSADHELEIGKNPDQFTCDADIVEAVCKGISEGEGINDKIEECSPPQMSRVEIVKLSESLWGVCLGVNIKAGYELSKALRKFEVQI
jgi:hypothetical protein